MAGPAKSGRAVLQDEKEALESGKKRFYVFGGFEFVDVFKELHSETFCYVYYMAAFCV